MKMNLFLTGIMAFFVLLMSCNKSETALYDTINQVFTSQDNELIVNEIKKYEEIVRNGEFDSISQIFTDDIVFIRPNNKNIIGIDSLFELHYSNLPAFPGFWKSAEEIDGSGHIAYTFGYYGFSEGVPSGEYLEIREKQEDGSWPVSRLTWNEILQK